MEIHSTIPIHNRFDHTNLNEVKIAYTYHGKTDTLASFDLNAHQKGELKLPIKEWLENEPIQVSFYGKDKKLIDSYKIIQNKTPLISLVQGKGKIEVVDEGQLLKILTNRGDFVVDKATGLFTGISTNGNELAFSGPHLVYRTKGKKLTYSSNAINTYGGKWKLNDLTYEISDEKVILTLQGSDDGIFISYTIEIDTNGMLTTRYSYKGLPKEKVREIGIKYITDDIFDEVSWNRKSYWSSYPKGHLSAPIGKSPLYTDTLNYYRNKPQKPWARDTKSFYYDGVGDENKDELVLIAKATKEDVFGYSLLQGDNKSISVIGEGDVSCRLAKKDGKIELYLNDQIDYMDLNWGNHQRNIVLNETFIGEVKILLKPE